MTHCCHTACPAGARRSIRPGGASLAAPRPCRASRCRPEAGSTPCTYSAPWYIVVPAVSHPAGMVWAMGESALTTCPDYGVSSERLRTAVVPKTQTLRRQCPRSCSQCARMQAWLAVHAMHRRTTALDVPFRRHSHLERATVDARGGRRDKGPAPTHDRSRHTWSSPAGIRLWSSVQSIAAGQDRLHSLQSDDWAGETGDDVSWPDNVLCAKARRHRFYEV